MRDDVIALRERLAPDAMKFTGKLCPIVDEFHHEMRLASAMKFQGKLCLIVAQNAIWLNALAAARHLALEFTT